MGFEADTDRGWVGCENTFGCGVKTLWLIPSAVALSSSSRSSFEPADTSSVELLRTLSLSLSLSSYSSWLEPATLVDRGAEPFTCSPVSSCLD